MFRREISKLTVDERRVLEEGLLRAAATRAPALPIPRRPSTAPCALSFAQQRLWFLDQYEPQTGVYNIAVAQRLEGRLQREALRRALQAVVARHEALRTTFTVHAGTPVQVIGAPAPFDLPLTDVPPGPEAAQHLRRSISEEAERPFDLEHDLMLRGRLFRQAEDDHVLLLVVHHIAADGWSLGVLCRELSALYREFTTGPPASLPKLPIQYADYAVWQRAHLSGPFLDGQLAYWGERLTDAPALLEVPTDRPRPAVQTSRGGVERAVLPVSLLKELRALSRREGVTLFMTLLAGFKVLLSRYAAQDDIVVGTAIAGRTRVETEGLIGFFVNTLVLRTDLSGGPTFREMLRRVREVALGAYARQELPFEMLVEALRPERSLAYSPLFQYMFILQNIPRSPLALAGLSVTPVRIERTTAKFDLTWSIEETPPGLQAAVEYSRDLFEPGTIQRMLRNYETLLTGAVADPECRIPHLPLLHPAERRLVLAEWNQTEAEYPRDATLHELFDAQAARTPDAIAVECAGVAFTYDELRRRANRLAHHLREHGVGPDVPVAVSLERSLDAVVAILGILKAGGAYLPLDPAYPRDRIALMLAEARPPVLVTGPPHRAGVAASGARSVDLEADRDVIGRRPDGSPPSAAGAASAAYVLYTSGSAGRPKGVVGLHRGAVNRCVWMARALPFGPGEVCCQKTSLNFVDSVAELFGPLLHGVPVVIVPDVELADPPQLIRTLAAHRISRIVLVPSLLRVLLGTFPDLGRRLPELRVWVSSGEALTTELRDRFHTILPDRVLLNLYGASEAAGDSTWYDTRGRLPGAAVPIGRPIANTRVYVVDAYGQPTPIGVPGELYIGGDGLAGEYLHQPELTAARFVPDPFADGPGTRLYRTGDLVRYRPDGNLEYLGRTDLQVKIRGFRIEPAEVEAALTQHPAVKDAVVLARDDETGDRRLVAYLVAASDTSLDLDAVRSQLREILPEHMVPSDFVLLDALPRTPNGKLARDRLPDPERTGSRSPSASRPPAGRMELALAGIWRDVLGVTAIGAADRFFDLGGHSLQSMQVIARVEADHGLRLSPRDLLTQNLAQLAALCEEHLERPSDPPVERAAERLLSRVRRLIRSRLSRIPVPASRARARAAGVERP